MLILTYTNGLRIDLNKFRKRILNSSCNRGSASLSYVEVRELLGSKCTCGINGSTCFVGNNVLNMGFGNFADDLGNDRLGLS